MKAPCRFRWSSAGSLLASAALLGFLGGRTVSIAHRLPSLLRTDGVREGWSTTLEQRFRRALAQAPVTRSDAAESAKVLALLRTHVPEHAHVLAELERGREGKELAGLLTTLAFPRGVRPVRMEEVEREGWAGLAGADGLYALVRIDAGESGWKRAATRIARTAEHELWRLPDRGP
jgi:hypothetical protein